MTQPGIEELIVSAIDAAIMDLDICVPCTVKSINRDEVTATVEVDILAKFADGTNSDPVQILDLPIMYGFSTKHGIYFDLEPGDKAVIVCGQRNLDNWRVNGPRTPPDALRFILSSGFVFPSPTHQDMISTLKRAPRKGCKVFGPQVFMGNIERPNPPYLQPTNAKSTATNQNIDIVALLQEIVVTIQPTIAGIDAVAGARLTSINNDLISLLTGQVTTYP